MREKTIVIQMYTIYERSVSSRASIASILDKIRKETNIKVILDFNQVVFISRSAAQQIVLEKKDLAKNNIKIELLNITPDVNKILEVAEHNLQRRKIDYENVNFETKNELENFILAF